MRSYKNVAGNDAVVFDRIGGRGYVEVEKAGERRLFLTVGEAGGAGTYLLTPRQAEQLATVLLAWSKGEHEAFRLWLLGEEEEFHPKMLTQPTDCAIL